MAYDIFISYRREGGKEIARPLKEALTSKGFKVFLDFDEITDGHFDERIINALDSAPIFMVILSENSLDRCVNENDWVRKEIERALEKGKHIIPINPDKKFKAFPEELPKFIKNGLGQHQISILDTEQLFHESINKIIENRIKKVIKKSNAKRNKLIAYTIIGLVLIAALSSILKSAFTISEEELDQQVDIALALYEKGDSISIESALQIFTKLEKHGNALAAFNVGVIYAERKDYTTAFEHYTKAAELNMPEAKRVLGTYYLQGKGVEKNEDLAFSLSLSAAHDRDVYAMFNTANMLYNGIGTPKDLEASLKWYIAAGHDGNIKAMKWAALMYANGEGTETDYEQALYWIKKAAEQGDNEAIVSLASYYIMGIGTEKNINQGIRLWQHVGDNGYYYGYSNLAFSYLDENELGKDAFLAETYWNKIPKDSDIFKSDQEEFYLKLLKAKEGSQFYYYTHASSDNSANVIGVATSKLETRVYIAFTNLDSAWYTISPDTILKAGNKTYKLTSTLNCEISPNVSYIDSGETAYMALIFPSIPSNSQTITVSEGGDGWLFEDISLK